MSRKVHYILMGIGLVAVAALCWFFLLSPLRGDIAETESAIEEQRNQISIAKTALAQSQVTRDEGRRNQARLLELSKMVPPTEELPSLLLQLQDLADQSGIDFLAVTPGEPRAGEENAGYLILPLQLQFSGSYFDVSDFAYRAEQMVAGPGRLLAISAVDLSPEGAGGEGASPNLGVSVSMNAFILTEPAPPPAVAAPAETTDED
ncbi:MAG: type 4a pilus biogenesis protein PilO [Thermoleophilia bacterium]|nr:type 4a pilus biogenesis protein PilO [Thermoleophilia bacterium]